MILRAMAGYQLRSQATLTRAERAKNASCVGGLLFLYSGLHGRLRERYAQGFFQKFQKFSELHQRANCSARWGVIAWLSGVVIPQSSCC